MAGQLNSNAAAQRYLDRLKRSNPSPEVSKVIREIEDEMKKSPSRPKGRRTKKSGPKLAASH